MIITTVQGLENFGIESYDKKKQNIIIFLNYVRKIY